MKPSIQLIPQRPVVCHDRQTTLSVLVRARAPRAEVTKRPNLNVGICIDRSGSMDGSPILRAKEAGCHLVGRLEPIDVVSVVAFSDVIEVLASSREVGLTGHTVIDRLLNLSACGGTALHEGWVESAHQVQRGAGKGRLSRILMLSDGEANVGLTDPARISAEVAKWSRLGVSTTTIGLGAGYNEDLLSQMAQAGNGNFHHVRTPQDILSTFQMELHGLCSTFGSDVSFGIQGKNGVELLRVVNPLEQSSQGRWKVADLAHGHPIELVLEFLVPATAQEVDLGEISLRWTDVQTGEVRETSEVLRLPVVPYGQLSEFPPHPEVTRKKVLQEVACLMRDSVELMGHQSYSQAEAKLKEAVSSLEQLEATPEVRTALEQLRQLLGDLDRGQAVHARKHASSYVSSYGSSSLVVSRGFRDFMALPEDQRTPEKLKELLERDMQS